jgi:hypothetical protein
MSTTPDKSPGTPTKSVSLASVLNWDTPTLQKKYKAYCPGGQQLTTKPNLLRAILEALLQMKLLQEAAAAYDDVPKGVPPYSSQIADTASEMSLLKSSIDALTKELARMKDTMVTVTETNDSLLAQVIALKEELHDIKSSGLRNDSETRERTIRKIFLEQAVYNTVARSTPTRVPC